ncbi:CHAP domain-containing protein [Gordonia malaquae]|uniref:CHAP domain-containing protein n=1 Tax=Gordonia malaquae TaxID=410332 RepID=UPI0030C794A4
MRSTVGRFAAVLLALVLAALGMTLQASPARALTSVDAFVAQWNGQYAEYDGANGAQCVDLFNFYNRDVVGAPRIGVTYAAELFNAAPGAYYDKLEVGAAPRKGDVAVWGASFPNGSGGAGHVAIVLADQGAQIQVLTQNPGATKIASMTKGHITGYLRPKNLAGDPLSPVGSLDEVSSPSPGKVKVRGWAFDRDALARSIDVHVYVGGGVGTAGVEGHALTANVSRPDVDSAHGVGALHGFDSMLATNKRGRQDVCVYAINIGGGDSVELGCRAVTIDSPPVGSNPVGSIDEVSSPAGAKVKVRGWAFDRDTVTQSIAVHVYIGGGLGTPGVESHALTANVARNDVDKAHNVGAFHGYEAVLSTKKTGQQRVCVYALNTGPGATVELGCRTVTISEKPSSILDTIGSGSS